MTSPAYWGTDLLDKFPKSKDESPVPALGLSYANLIQGLLGDAAGTHSQKYRICMCVCMYVCVYICVCVYMCRTCTRTLTVTFLNVPRGS